MTVEQIEQLERVTTWARGLIIAQELEKQLNITVTSFRLVMGWQYNDEGYDWSAAYMDQHSLLVNGQPVDDDYDLVKNNKLIESFIQTFQSGSAEDYDGDTEYNWHLDDVMTTDLLKKIEGAIKQ